MYDMNLRTEISRKILHLLSALIPACIYFLEDKSIYLPLLIGITIVMLIFDYSRIHLKNIRKFFYQFFSIFMRDNEKKQITGASFLFIGSSIVALLFDKEVAIIGLLVLSFSDSFAAIIGLTKGRTKLFNKTLEGSTAFFVSTMTILIIFNFNILNVLIISLIITIVELLSSYKYNDNISIPFSTCLCVYISNFI